MIKSQERLNLPTSLVGFTRYDDSNSFYKELDRYRRHDHGGGDDGDDWLDDDEIDEDFQKGKREYGHVLLQVNTALKISGFKPNAVFDLGEKGHFSIVINLKLADRV